MITSSHPRSMWGRNIIPGMNYRLHFQLLLGENKHKDPVRSVDLLSKAFRVCSIKADTALQVEFCNTVDIIEPGELEDGEVEGEIFSVTAAFKGHGVWGCW